MRLMVLTLLLGVFGGEVYGGKLNFVVVISDDQDWRDNGCYGNKVVRTPNIDGLAKEGMRFTHAFTSTGMCAPSRSMLYTGLYPVRNGAYPNHSKVKAGLKSLPHYLKKAGYRVVLAGKKHIGPAKNFPFEYMGLGGASKFLKEVGDTPFCLIVATNDPHVPWKKNKIYDVKKIDVRPNLVDTPETRAALADYYTDITVMDGVVGDVLNGVKENGHEGDTVFIYTSDQGAQFPFGKWTCYDAGLRVPFIVRWPGVISGGSVNDAMIHFVDVVPTLLELAGVKGVKGLDGKSFAGVLRGERKEHRDEVYGIQTTRGIIDGSKSYPIRSIRTRRYQLILNLQAEAKFVNVLITRNKRYWGSWVARGVGGDAKAKRLVDWYQKRPRIEFYDLKLDPNQLRNLAGEEKYARTIEAMKGRLFAWMKEQGDEGIATELLAKERKGRKQKSGKKNRKRDGG